MKKLMITMLILSALSINAQVVKVDNVKCYESENIKERLELFRNQNENSQIFIIAGGAVYLLGAYVLPKKTGSVPNILPYVGGAAMIYGTVIYLDSFKFLNFKRPIE